MSRPHSTNIVLTILSKLMDCLIATKLGDSRTQSGMDAYTMYFPTNFTTLSLYRGMHKTLLE